MTAEIREAFDHARARIEQLRRDGMTADDITRAHATDVDNIVTGVYTDAMSGLDRDHAGISLVALGGYGRKELAPNSDLDLLLLYRGWSSNEVTDLNRAVMYPLWDSRRELGDRIREPRDVVRNLDQIDEVCALLDARLLAGDRGLFADLEAVVSQRIDRDRVTFFKRLSEASTQRHHRYAHAGHLLEPNIRDSAGGLRDIHTLEWAAKVLPAPDGIAGLVHASYMSQIDADIITAAREYLLRLRIELHLATARHQDQLYLAEQDEIARRLGYEPAEGRPAADRLMQELFGHARQVDAVVSSFWHRLLASQRRRRWRTSRTENVGDGCVIRDGLLEVVAVTDPSIDVAGWLRIFRRSATRDVPIGRASLNRLHDDIATGDVTWSPEARNVFIDVLEAGGVRALEQMDLAGLLVALFEEWEHIRAFPQRDLYHRYTVDRHLFVTVAELAASRSADDLDVRDAWSKVGDQHALFVAALFHDVGKGRGGDHSAIGAGLSRTAAQRMGMTTQQIDDVSFLVAEHLSLAESAVRRDLNEPKTIHEMAERTSDLRRLAMLYLLTRADSIATGAEAWSSFRSSLIRELYGRTAHALAGEYVADEASASQRLSQLAESLELSRDEAIALIGPMPDSWTVGLDVASARRQLQLLMPALRPDEVRTGVHHLDEADEFIVVANDRPGLFSTVTGVLALRGFDVHDAEIYTRSDGVAIEVFRVVGAHGAVPDERWARLGPEIAEALAGTLDVDKALRNKAAQSRRRPAARKKETDSRILVDNGISETHTVIEVHTGDKLGLLRLITKTLADAGCDLYLAKVATYGVEVVDVFYVRDLEGRKISDPEHLAAIESALRAALG